MSRLSTIAAFSLFGSVLAQDFIHYKFDSTCTNEVINYATGAQALASNGTLQSTAATQWVAGVFGSALAQGTTVAPLSHNRVVTGWDPSVQNVTGDLTMAWFMRQGPVPIAATINYTMGAPTGGFRQFTNGIAGRGLYQRVILAGGGNGINATIANDFYLPAATADIQTMAAAGWVHVAMVVDSVAQTADWYINGVSVLQLAGVPGALINAAGPFMVGAYSTAATAAGSNYDVDEFIMSLRAFSPAEILALSQVPQAGAGAYLSGTTTQCGSLTLSSTGGRPSAGNAAYALSLNPAAPSYYVVFLGYDRCTFGGGLFQLPLDGGLLSPLAAGCQVLTDFVSDLSGVSAGGPTSVPFAIPGGTMFIGLTLYSQAAAIDLGTTAVSASNGLSISVGS